jgi:hypothetical protein
MINSLFTFPCELHPQLSVQTEREKHKVTTIDIFLLKGASPTFFSADLRQIKLMIIKYKFIDRNEYVKRAHNLYTLFHTGRFCIKNLADNVLQEIIFSEFSLCWRTRAACVLVDFL